MVKRYSKSKVLVVVDIDNTLLAMNQDLGSDQWFGWQSDLLKYAAGSLDLVADDFDGLLEVQSSLFSLSEMHPPQPELPGLMKKIQATGVTAIVLTSRGYTNRGPTERELERNKYDFSKSALNISEKRGRFYPYDAKRASKFDFSKKEIEKLLSSHREVSYSSGVFMTAGQDKGLMLRALIARSGKRGKDFKAIVLWMDHMKHTTRMHNAFKKHPMKVVTFRYSREDGNVSNFKKSKKRHVVRQWNQLKKLY